MTDEWTDHVREWSHPPVDDVGYIASARMIHWSDDQLRDMVEKMIERRRTGWRNWAGLWVDSLRLDSTTGKDVLDYGAGTGVEALMLARNGNSVSIADISSDNLRLVHRIFGLYGLRPATSYKVGKQSPLHRARPESYDVFHCNGVLHHCRDPRTVLEAAHRVLRPQGEVRLMVYSDIGWRIATGKEPPLGIPPENDPSFERFVRYFDAVGEYADWYDRSKIEAVSRDLFKIEDLRYITEDSRYMTAVLRKVDE